MLIGVPKEIKNNEYRVGITPTGVRELIAYGHQLIIQQDAGASIGLTDSDYRAAGAEIVMEAEEVFARADLIVKVKEPQAQECDMLHSGQILFTFLHLAPDPSQTKKLIAADVIAIAYETVTDDLGGLPLLAPMSEVAGRMAIQAGAHALEKEQGGSGVLLAGVPGVLPAKVVIIGGGVVGSNAARMALGLGADVVMIDRTVARLRQLDKQFGSQLKTLYSTRDAIEKVISDADLVIGAVLVPGTMAPKLITRDMLAGMKKGAVLLDVAIDQGGCFETSKPTTHQNPIYEVDGIVHYCVANMPGAVAQTSAIALTHATLPFVLALANKGYIQAISEDKHLRNGLNVYRGKVTCKGVAESLGYDYVDAAELI